MDGLHQWYFAEEFSAYDAAVLMVGHNPASSNQIGSGIVREILSRMRKDYETACASYSYDVKGFYAFDTADGVASRKAELISVNLNSQIDAELMWSTGSAEKLSELVRWIHSKEGDFNNQTFSRREIRRWLTENRLPHVYDFASPSDEQVLSESAHDSMTDKDFDKQVSGKSETSYLGIIGALCDLYWKNKYPNGEKIVIADLLRQLEAYAGFTGLSERNLKEKLPKAIKIVRNE